MAGLLASVLLQDAATFCDPDGFAETITFTPRGGQPLTIQAVIFRSVPQAIHGIADYENVTFIDVINSATLGILGNAINIGADTVTFSGRIDDGARDYIIRQIVSQDHGMLRLLVS